MKERIVGKESVLVLNHVGVCYRRPVGIFRRETFWALRDVSFRLFRGETLGVIGKNGAGKSTLLRLLAGIIKPDRGELVAKADRASLLSLQVGFLPYLTGRENAILSGMLLGMRRSDMEERMGDVIAFAELEDFIDQPVRIGDDNGVHAEIPDAIADPFQSIDGRFSTSLVGTVFF